MAARIASGFVGALALGLALWVGTRSSGQVPPLGAILDPAHGVWGLAAHAEHPPSDHASVPGLEADVDILYDDRGVPHIFAANELDATRALGFVVARDRLFQLEVQTRAASGTLTELVGAAALELDRDTRRAGLPWGAARKYAQVSELPEFRTLLNAYADGVNAYIDQMDANRVPLEYRLLNAAPQRWRPEHALLLLVRMGQTLAWSDFEMTRVRVTARVGREAADALFPQNAYVQEPVQPFASRDARPAAARTLPAPQRDDAAAALARLLGAGPPGPPSGPARASNNWAVAPSRSASGAALLANDPHLDLTLPSIWYEAHLVVRDTLDVYGVTIPGAPSVVLGFNRAVAWGATNVGADVADYYVETVDDTTAPTRYRVDGEWRALQLSIEPYRDPHGDTLAIDTLRYTHRGPMFRAGDAWISRRWLVLEPSSDFDAFRAAGRARSVGQFFAIMDRYESPAQNLVVADTGGHIGIRSTGRYPLRPGGRGDTLFDGAHSASDWIGWISPVQAPQSIDPAQGYVASANQQPADPRAFPAYLGTEWPDPWRALHLNALLRADSAMTPEAMRRMQTDPGNARADAFVPLLLAAAAAVRDSSLSAAARLLADWDRQFTPENERAVLFENTMRALNRATWDELAADTSVAEPTRFLAMPNESVLLALTRDPGSVWWDQVRTPQRERRDDILAASLIAGYEQSVRDHGPPDAGGWRWSRIRFANIRHLLAIEPLSALNIPVQGGQSTLSPSSGNGRHGASWRLVVEMTSPPRAWATYPGGQSGNPASRHYRDRVDVWRRGDLDSLRVPRTPGELSPLHLSATLRLQPAEAR